MLNTIIKIKHGWLLLYSWNGILKTSFSTCPKIYQRLGRQVKKQFLLFDNCAANPNAEELKTQKSNFSLQM